MTARVLKYQGDYPPPAGRHKLPSGLTWREEPPILNPQRWTRTNHGALVPMPPAFLAWTVKKDAAGTVELRHTHDAAWTRKEMPRDETKHGQRDFIAYDEATDLPSDFLERHRR